MAKSVIDELVTLFTLRSDKKSEKVVSGMRTRLIALKRVGLIAGAALTAAGAGVGILLKKTNESVDAQAKFAKTINTSFENLQALQFAGKLVGVSMDDINSALETLATTMDPAIPGEYNRELLLLGINSKNAAGKLRAPIAVLLDISNKIKDLGKGKQLSIAKAFGFSPGVTRLLLEGPKAIAKAMKEARTSGDVLPEGSARIAAKFDKEVVKLKSTIKGLVSTLLLGLTPAVSKTLAVWEKYIIANRKVIALKIKDFITGAGEGFKNFGSVLSSVFGVVDKMAKKLGLLSGKTNEVKTTAIVIEGILFGLTAAFLAANIEIVAVVAAITALVALAPKIKSTFKEISTGVKKQFEDIKQKGFFSVVKTDVKASFKRLGKNLGKLESLPTGRIKIPVTPAPAVTNRATTVSNRAATTNHVTINVSGAGSPAAVGKEVLKKFQSLSSAVQVASPGINAPPVG